MSNHQSTALARPIATAAARVDEITRSAAALFAQPQSFAVALEIAQSMVELRTALNDEVMRPIMGLQNSPLGFVTDRPDGYDVQTVKSAFIEAQLRGYRPIGNEWNILAGRFYATRNGLRRRLVAWPGISDLRESYGIPKATSADGADVQCSATWKLNGTPDNIDAEIRVRLNRGMGSDGALGKAQRKLYARIIDRLSGIYTPDGDADETDAPIQPTRTAPAAAKAEWPATVTPQDGDTESGQASDEDRVIARLESAQTEAEVQALVPAIQALPADAQERLRPVYAEHRKRVRGVQA